MISLLLSSISFLSSTQPLPTNTKSHNSSLSRYAVIQTWNQVQHTPLNAYTNYYTHRVLHVPSIALSLDLPSPAPSWSPISHCSADHIVLRSLHSHNDILTNNQHRHSCCTPLTIHCLQIANLEINSHQQHLQSGVIGASRYVSEFTWLWCDKTPDLLSHPKSILGKEWFRLKDHIKRVRGFNGYLSLWDHTIAIAQ